MAEFVSQSSLQQKEDDMPIVKVLVQLSINGPGVMRATSLRSDIQAQSGTHVFLVCEPFVAME